VRWPDWADWVVLWALLAVVLYLLFDAVGRGLLPV
jgi:hypothetical protein